MFTLVMLLMMAARHHDLEVIALNSILITNQNNPTPNQTPVIRADVQSNQERATLNKNGTILQSPGECLSALQRE